MTLPDPGELADRILAGHDDALDGPTMQAYLEGTVDTWALMNAADRVRRARFGNRVHLCSIVNAKEGGCPEDCGFCSQSKHFTTHVTPTKFTPVDEIVAASRQAAGRSASALGIVTATRGMDAGEKGFEHVLEAVRAIRRAGATEAHASLGLLTDAALDQLVDAGVTELNHNLETGRSYFGKIVTTHGYDERIDTIRRAKARGLRTCVGGIMGMGESAAHRVELAMDLRALDVDEVPLNFLVSIDGTRLERVEAMEPLEMLRIIACFRLALPRPNIFIAAGRLFLGQLQPLIFAAGASGMMIGDFLTTPNRSVDDDLEMVRSLGLEVMACGATDRPELAHVPAASPRTHLPVMA